MFNKPWCKLPEDCQNAETCMRSVIEVIYKLWRCASVGANKVLICRYARNEQYQIKIWKLTLTALEDRAKVSRRSAYFEGEKWMREKYQYLTISVKSIALGSLRIFVTLSSL
jgi:bifunctional pyridoxal-dependent enzyme with beta-cystathionase and maltose regulon repressor activities